MAGFLYVGAGGALGAALRYAISLLPYKGLFPALTLITNVLGAAAIGCSCREWRLAAGAMNSWWLFLKPAYSGGFINIF